MPAAPLHISAPSVYRGELSRASTSQLLFDAVSFACLGGLILATIVLIARRASGGLAEPLSAMPLFVAGLLVAVLTALAQWPHVRRRLTFPRVGINATDVARLGVPIAVAVLFAGTITLPGTTFGGGLLLWLPIIATQIAIAALHRRRTNVVRPTTISDSFAPQDSSHVLAERGSPPLPVATRHTFDEVDEESLADNATQQWIRRTIEGADVLEGLARAHFEPGVRATNLHVGICPPFASVPEVFVEIADDSAATVKIAEALPFGVRLEVRLMEACDMDASVVVAVVARA
jgi:hypothetical protein